MSRRTSRFEIKKYTKKISSFVRRCEANKVLPCGDESNGWYPQRWNRVIDNRSRHSISMRLRMRSTCFNTNDFAAGEQKSAIKPTAKGFSKRYSKYVCALYVGRVDVRIAATPFFRGSKLHARIHFCHCKHENEPNKRKESCLRSCKRASERATRRLPTFLSMRALGLGAWVWVNRAYVRPRCSSFCVSFFLFQFFYRLYLLFGSVAFGRAHHRKCGRENRCRNNKLWKMYKMSLAGRREKVLWLQRTAQKIFSNAVTWCTHKHIRLIRGDVTQL